MGDVQRRVNQLKIMGELVLMKQESSSSRSSADLHPPQPLL